MIRAPMYICICNAIRENDLRMAALGCDGDAAATYACLGKRPNCGQCLEEAQEIIDAARAATHCDFLAVEAA
jgi:bacterioferritin-associated ferredoxin